MNAALDLLNRARLLGVTINAKAGKLKISAPKGAVTPKLKSELAANKSQILALLLARTQTAPPMVYEVIVDGKTLTVIDPAAESLDAFTKSVKARFGSKRVDSITQKR